MVYEPQEDSFLLQKYVQIYSIGKVLEVGTGSGIQAKTASKKADSVLAVDIDPEAIDYCKQNVKTNKITFKQSDLFSKVKGKFDLIIFNPPYLPNEQDIEIIDPALYGGDKGYEVIERFLNSVNSFLKRDGKILLLFSSFSKKGKVEKFIRNNNLLFHELEKKHIFFEDLYVYLIQKMPEIKSVENISYFTSGQRGYLYTGKYKNKKVVIKIKNPLSEAENRILNEYTWLKKLNKLKIGPNVISGNKDYFFYQFIEGVFLQDYIFSLNSKKQIKLILKKVFEQCFILDQLDVDKEEMHRPIKHILVDKKGNPTMIDFERMHHSEKPKNVTQFCQYLIGGLFSLLQKKKFKFQRRDIIKLTKNYKQEMIVENLNKILDGIV